MFFYVVRRAHWVFATGAMLLGQSACLMISAANHPDPVAVSTSAGDTGFPYVPDGQVNAVKRVGDQVYLGGSFSTMAVGNIGNGILFSAEENLNGLDALSSSLQWASYPRINGEVKAVIDDGSGGFIVGGTFTKIGTTSISYIARLRADFSIDTSFAVTVDSEVAALARDGNQVYIGGSFANINASGASPYLAEVNLADGALQAFSVTLDRYVSALALSATTIYVAGSFSNANAQVRTGVAAFLRSNGAITAWDPDVDTTDTVKVLIPVGANMMVGGSFSDMNVNTAPAGCPTFCATDAATGAFVASAQSPDGQVRTGFYDGSAIYIGGDFTNINGSQTGNLAKLDPVTLAADPIDSAIAGSVSSISLQGSTLYLGGSFVSVNGLTRYGLAALNSSDLSPTDWNPSIQGTVNQIMANSDSLIFVGGVLSGTEVHARNNLASVNVSDGSLTDFNPNLNGTVHSLEASATRLYVGGGFSMVGAVARNRSASFNLIEGWLDTSFNPNLNSAVYAQKIVGSQLILGGAFTTVGGTARLRIASVNLTTGAMGTFYPAGGCTSGQVNDIETNSAGTRIYLGGSFVNCGGVAQSSAIAFVSSNSSYAAWTPNPDGIIYEMAHDSANDTIILAGTFGNAGGQARTRLAEVSSTVGTASSWAPNPSGTLDALEYYDGKLFVSGNYNLWGGVAHLGPLLIQMSDHSLVSGFGPGVYSGVMGAHMDDSGIYMGGTFDKNGDHLFHAFIGQNTDGTLLWPMQ